MRKITAKRSRPEQFRGVHKCPRQSIESCTGKDFKSWLKGCAIGSSVLCQWAHKGSISNHPANFQLEDTIIQEKIREAYKHFHLLKADPDCQDTWIAGLIQAQAQAEGMLTKSLWKQHRQTEKARTTTRLVQAALHSNTRYGTLQAVIGPTPEGQCQEFASKYSLERACLDEAGHWFSQANDTPLLEHPIIKWFGETGTNKPAFKQVLSGKFCHEPENIYIQKLLQQLKNQNKYKKLHQELSKTTLTDGEKCKNLPHLPYREFILAIIWLEHSTPTM